MVALVFGFKPVDTHLSGVAGAAVGELTDEMYNSQIDADFDDEATSDEDW